METTMHVQSLEDRADYAADLAGELAALMSDQEDVALMLRFVALRCALIASRRVDEGQRSEKS